MRAEDAQDELRKALVDRGVLTPEQADAVKLERVDPEQFPDVPRCRCEKCQNSEGFMALTVDESRLSRLQLAGVATVFNDMAKPFLPAPTDPEKWNGGRRLQ